MPKFNPDIHGTPEYAPLADWLDKQRARFMWSSFNENGPTTHGYVVNAVLVIVMLYRPMHASKIGGGWDIYVPADPNSVDINTCLRAVEKALGIVPEVAS